MTRVKICGLMNRADVESCVRVGVNMVGFVVDYPIPVPWNLTMAEAGMLIRKTPPFVSTCVVTGGASRKVLKLAHTIRPHAVQLHYQETLQEIREIVSGLQSIGVKTIKALRIAGTGQCDFEISDPATAARELVKTGVDALLVDSYTASSPGGTGVKVDLDIFRIIQQVSSIPVILAGGLTPLNIAAVIRQERPYAVDVLTGVEKSPGHKDTRKIDQFIKNMSVEL